MPIRGRYNPFNLTAFNRKLDHNLLIASSLLDDNHPQYFADTTIGTRTKDYTTTGTGTFGNITIFNPIPILVLKDSTYAGATSLGYIEWRDSNNTRLGFFGNASSGDDDLYWKNESSGGHIKIETTGAGEFQIFANTVLNGTVTATGDVTAGLARIGNVGGLGNLSSTSGNLSLISAGGIIFLGEDNALQSTGLIQTTDELRIGEDATPNRVEFTNTALAFRTTGDYVIQHSTDQKDILFKVLDTSFVTLLQLDASARLVKVLTSLDVANTITGTTFTDGTATLSGGNLTSMGNITGADVDIDAGTGTINAGFVDISQNADSAGIFCRGFDDESTATMDFSIDAFGDAQFAATNANVTFQTVTAGKFIYFLSKNDLVINLGDAAGVNKFKVRDSASVEQFAVDSNGNITNVSDITSDGDITTTGTTKEISQVKAKWTIIGGFAIKLTNKTGVNTVAGQLVRTSAGTDDAFSTVAANSQETIAIVLDAGIADGSEAWVVTGGIADVLMDAGGSVHGDRIISSATAGSADVWNVGGAVATHFQEIGHCLETRVGAGLARVNLHFN